MGRKIPFYAGLLIVYIGLNFFPHRVIMAQNENPRMRDIVEKQSNPVTATNKIKNEMFLRYANLPFQFIENKGQIQGKIRFYEKGNGHSIYFGEEGVYLSLYRRTTPESRQIIRSTKGEKIFGTIEEISLKLSFLGANPHPEIVGEHRREGKVNYFLGSNPEKWATNISTYGAVLYKNVYKGIDIKFYGKDGNLEYDLVVHPGADLEKVQLCYEGIKDLKMSGSGNLIISINGSSITQHKPIVYQQIDGKRVERSGSFKIIDKNTYAFYVGDYDGRYPLILDPALSYSTYLGGNGNDTAYGIAVDESGNIYVAGDTWSSNFPTQNAIQQGHGGGYTDAFITKFSADGSHILFSTYLGGNGIDTAYAIVVDESGNIYVAGETWSSNFPTQNAIQKSYGGVEDAFIAKLSADGSSLVFSTYLGGNNGDGATAIAVDGVGNIYVGGYTSSIDFPTQNAIQKSLGGWIMDAFIVKLSGDGSFLLFSTYLGGSLYDEANAIAVDKVGNVYVAGWTTSYDFPTKNFFQESLAGWEDVFIAKLSGDGSNLIFSTYLGGGNIDYANALAVDEAGNMYVAGRTYSSNFPITENAFQKNFGGNTDDAFVTKFSGQNFNLIFSTFLGGNSPDEASSIGIDVDGNIYVAGWTDSYNFSTKNAFQENKGGLPDAFIAKLSADGSALLFSTFLGGNLWDEAHGLVLDMTGNVYVAGGTSSFDFPITENAFQKVFVGLTTDAFVAKISGVFQSKIPEITVTPLSLDFGSVNVGLSSDPQEVTISNDGNVTLSIGDISLTGANASEFTKSQDEDTCSGHVLSPGESCTLEVLFSPASIGIKTATLSIPSNDLNENPVLVNLSGIGYVKPQIDNLSPSSGPVGTLVTIQGLNFGATKGTSTVKFGSKVASVTSWSSTQIQAKIPSLPVGTYDTIVTTKQGPSNAAPFTVIVAPLPPPTITSISPTSGTAGTIVTIRGKSLGTTQGNSFVSFGTAQAVINSWSNTQIKAVAPSGLPRKVPLTVITLIGTSNAKDFTYLSTISSRPLKNALRELQLGLVKAVDRHTERTALVYSMAAQARVNNGWFLELLRAFWTVVDIVIEALGKLIDISAALFFTLAGSAEVASDATKLGQVWNGLKDAKNVLANASFVATLGGFFQSIDDFNLFRTVTDELSVEAEKVYKRLGLPRSQTFVKGVLAGKDRKIESPVIVPERSGSQITWNRHETFTWARGTSPVIDDINRKFRTLINEIPSKLPAEFPQDEIVAYLNELRSKILSSETGIAGIHFFASQDGFTFDKRAIALGLVASDLNQANAILDAILNRLDVQYREAWDQTIDIGLGVLKLHFSQIDFGSRAYRTVRVLEDAATLLEIPSLPQQVIELFNQNVNPVDAINYLSMQMTWDLGSEIARLWTLADGVAGVPDRTVSGEINGGFVRYLIGGNPFPSM